MLRIVVVHVSIVNMRLSVVRVFGCVVLCCVGALCVAQCLFCCLCMLVWCGLLCVLFCGVCVYVVWSVSCCACFLCLVL